MENDSTSLLNQYISSLPSHPTTIPIDILGKSYPWRNIIHRRAKDKSSIFIARTSQEFTNERTLINNTYESKISMNKIKMGISCTSSCVYAPQVKGGSIPIIELQRLLPEDLFVPTTDGVSIGGMSFKTQRCFHRVLTTATTTIEELPLTVGEALHMHGKDDRCLLGIEEKFSFYWDSLDHGTMCLRNDILHSSGLFTFQNLDQDILFSPNAYNSLEWKECENSESIKIPTVFIQFLLKNSNVTTENDFQSIISGFKAKKRNTFTQLWKLFGNELLDCSQEILLNELLTIVFDLNKLSDLDDFLLCATIDLIEEFIEDTSDGDTSYWFENLKPQLEKMFKDSEVWMDRSLETSEVFQLLKDKRSNPSLNLNVVLNENKNQTVIVEDRNDKNDANINHSNDHDAVSKQVTDLLRVSSDNVKKKYLKQCSGVVSTKKNGNISHRRCEIRRLSSSDATELLWCYHHENQKEKYNENDNLLGSNNFSTPEPVADFRLG